MPGPATQPHVLTYADSLDVTSLNPFLATSGNINAMMELTAAEFVRFDAHGRPLPELVTEIPTQQNGGVSRDGLTIVWHLRHGVRWSDGVPFDARDVLYTYRVAIDPANDILVRDVWTRLRSVDAPDRYTVVFHFTRPYALFVTDYFSTLGNAAILPEHVLGPGTSINQAPYNSAPVGIGPFRIVAYHRDDDVEMEANPYYWRGRPKLDRVIYKVVTDDNTLLTQLQTGELDLWDTVEGTMALRVRTLPGIATSSRLSNYMTGIYFNVHHGALTDPRVREALGFATDRTAMLDKAVQREGVITQSVVPRTTIDYLDLPIQAYDPARAGRLLDAAGWKLGSDGIRRRNGVPLTIDLALPSTYMPSATMAYILRDAWGKIGVDVTIHEWATSQFFATAAAGGTLQTGRFDAAIFSQSLGPIYSNINGSFDCASLAPHGFDVEGYCDPAVDALNDRYVHTFDPAVRRASAAAMQRRIDAATPVLVLHERLFLAAYTARLRGYHPNPYSFWGDPLQLDM